MPTTEIPAGYAVGKRQRVTWTRWDPARRRNVISHPYQVPVTDPDGTERLFDTRREAIAWIATDAAERVPDDCWATGPGQREVHDMRACGHYADAAP